MKWFWLGLFLFCAVFIWFDVYHAVHFSNLHNTAQTAFFGTCAILECFLAGFAGAMCVRELGR